ncbi:glycerol-3-phosphate 1-O-acyltransferase PlsY [Mycoplasma mycoides]|uniref:glycerol-3-phosphate 1-O-acyltransferase PlsY n=1 Tax=Mycoplasma mycoides TaxID=2102 RepID=UPI00223F7BB5|nr:glycerol-3-phosphate 1-O-acyltransferase PlsY [Mycoplasma mycoides]QVK05316.1 glycerol-3-phosphate 1-O-acyltransferase PlsY [Mycoplasma mycoides subsp. capri]QVK06108.1 glycerol-3-phosphate 1-O-acyltransferase PlsY [Mycoplasma mycoides subsp. capri]
MKGFFMHYLGIIIASVIGYFLGSISWSIIIVRKVGNIDIRTVGSGNPGATNTVRALGKKWGLVVAFLDALKVVFTAISAILLSMIPNDLFSQTSYFIPCIFALIGHCYPIYYKFKGGKAVSCFLGLLFVVNVLYLIIFLIIWFISVAISRKVSVASMFSALIILLIMWIPYLSGVSYFIWEWNGLEKFSVAWKNYILFSLLNSFHYWFSNTWASGILEGNIIILIGGLILAWRHSQNIKRIKNKTEPDTFPKKVKPVR